MNEWLKLLLHWAKLPQLDTCKTLNWEVWSKKQDKQTNKKIITYTKTQNELLALELKSKYFQAFIFPLYMSKFSTTPVLCWLGSHFHAARFLALSYRFSSRSHSFSFWRLRFLAIWSPSLCLVWCYHIAGSLVEAALACGAVRWLSALVVLCLLTCEAGQHTVDLMLELTYN